MHTAFFHNNSKSDGAVMTFCVRLAVGTLKTGLHIVLKPPGGPIPVMYHFVGELMGSL